MSKRIRDCEIRAAAHATLLRRARACPDTIVLDELGVDHGACRVDIAVINGHIRGIEIKADADVLDRLPRQVVAYGAVVDRATLIASPRHIARAMPMLPEWWGVMSAERRPSGKIAFRIVRREHANRSVDALTLARLLWRPEAAAILRALGTTEKRLRQPREELYQMLVEVLPRRVLAERVRHALKIREVWRDRPELS
ncbi:sce7726 family protein [Acetobacter okinawensis]|uniref:sce7726 family protein n=1 Tax=Acetobacter okinawensis TaxID=1076594 RepID=UPI00046E862D|nr:sce7726 family protein [Acetobacter okinawensis]